LSAVPEIFGGDHVQAATGKTELIGGFGRGEGALLERFKHMTNEGRAMSMY
jgi:hypothetical protein